MSLEVERLLSIFRDNFSFMCHTKSPVNTALHLQIQIKTLSLGTIFKCKWRAKLEKIFSEW